MAAFSYCKLLIEVLFRKRAQDKDAVQVAKTAKRIKCLHQKQPAKHVDDSGATDCNSFKRYVDVSVFILLYIVNCLLKHYSGSEHKTMTQSELRRKERGAKALSVASSSPTTQNNKCLHALQPRLQLFMKKPSPSALVAQHASVPASTLPCQWAQLE